MDFRSSFPLYKGAAPRFLAALFIHALREMLACSNRTLKILAALVWCTGGLVLAARAASLLRAAGRSQPDNLWPGLAILIGLLIGTVKVRFIFNRACLKNLMRIDQLNKPKIWQFYRPGFFLFLILMISLGASLSRMAQGDHALLISVAILDISIATALLGSSHVFWRERALAEPVHDEADR